MKDAIFLKKLDRLIQDCKEWDLISQRFDDIVNMYLTLTGADRMIMAEEFEVPGATVSRWASGLAIPLMGMQRSVVRYIENKCIEIKKSIE